MSFKVNSAGVTVDHYQLFKAPVSPIDLVSSSDTTDAAGTLHSFTGLKEHLHRYNSQIYNLTAHISGVAAGARITTTLDSDGITTVDWDGSSVTLNGLPISYSYLN